MLKRGLKFRKMMDFKRLQCDSTLIVHSPENKIICINNPAFRKIFKASDRLHLPIHVT
jgi:hypothetical protein